MDDKTIHYLELETKVIAASFREIGLEIDENPKKIYDYTHLDGVNLLSKALVPERFNDNPLKINGEKVFGEKVLERVIVLEQLAYGDVGVTLGAPGPSLSGQVMFDLASERQQERYYNQIINEHTWTFFALSEPQKGSDGANIETKISQREDVYYLNGEKKYIGNGGRAQIGIVFVKVSEGPLGIGCLLIDPRNKGFFSKKIDTLGVRGAGLAHLYFDDFVINYQEDILGMHLSPTRRGLWGAIGTFNKMRPSVAALALGVAQATMDYIKKNKRNYTTHEKYMISKYEEEIVTVRRLIRNSALQLDQDATLGYISSMAKVKAVKLVNAISEFAIDLFRPYGLIEHPFLNKWYRDAKAFEFMEGTSNIQKMNIYNQLVKRGKTYV
ncbi:acyl-CoA dehydrogenase family protein [Virgibacillus sp. C22-A2]|uniref:Acyl-CoA dehydrogenase family protein n=1 Tax=Virgibacillus tibetensis TaxID=3042313 RepID=A0ABU6KJC4_9BACI|nr:acyl-CoA dehydrogenase family protein [Virgibacillus sp. C22-A2]